MHLQKINTLKLGFVAYNNLINIVRELFIFFEKILLIRDKFLELVVFDM